jgi:hypothetical protein
MQIDKDIEAITRHYASFIATTNRLPGISSASSNITDIIDVGIKFVSSIIDVIWASQLTETEKRAKFIEAVMQFYREIVRPAAISALGRITFTRFIEPIIIGNLPEIVGKLYDASIKILQRKAAVTLPHTNIAIY